MGVKHIFLSLLSQKSMHGYELKVSFDKVMLDQWDLNFGQVYTTLNRLERDELLYCEDIPQEDKPDKKVYSITPKGKKELEHWLSEKPDWNIYPDEMAFKFIAISLLDEKSLQPILNSYRVYLLQLIKHLTVLRDGSMDGNLIQQLTMERNILRAEADLKWLELCNERLGGVQ